MPKVDFIGQKPIYKHLSDAGADLRSAESITINPGEHVALKTGTCVAIPGNYYGHIQSRSGLAKNHGIFVLTGTIDSGYHGEIIVILGNFGKEPFTIEQGDRIAQLVIMPYAHAIFTEVDSLEDSDRGINGYGSTGVK